MAVTKVIYSDEQSVPASPWRLPDVGGGSAKPKPVKTLAGGVTAEELEGVYKVAYDEGFAKGRQDGLAKGQQEGYAAGQADIRAVVARLEGLINALAQPFEQMDDEVETQLAELALSLSRQIIRREIQRQPGEIVAVIREAIGLLPVATREVRVHVNPEDARFINEAVAQGDGGSAWRLVEDPSMTRGGCRVVTDSSRIDATLERRIALLASQALGDERSEAPQEQE